MKTKEELAELKVEVEALKRKLAELTEDELKEVTGGLHNMPEKNPDEKYVMQSFDVPKDTSLREFHLYH